MRQPYLTRLALVSSSLDTGLSSMSSRSSFLLACSMGSLAASCYCALDFNLTSLKILETPGNKQLEHFILGRRFSSLADGRLHDLIGEVGV